jgi:hypothetical protein
MTKTIAAYVFTCAKLWESEEKLYFWTFTFTECMSDWKYSRCWSRFITEMQNMYGGQIKGIKVIEAHVTHGLHYHAILNKRLNVHEVRRVGREYGLGRVHVSRVRDKSVFDYLAKYLQKDCGELFDRVARWGTIGLFKGVRVKDVIVDSNLKTNVDALRAGGVQVKFWEYQMLKEFTKAYGCPPAAVLKESFQRIRHLEQQKSLKAQLKENPF